MERDEMVIRSHALVLPFPLQGHINPLLQFCKRLTPRGIAVTFCVPSRKISVQQQYNFIDIEPIPERIAEGEKQGQSFDDILENFKADFVKHLPIIIERQSTSDNPAKILVFDSMMPWALDVAQRLEIPGAAFFTQSCAVSAIYYHLHQGTFKIPLERPSITLPSLPPLEWNDLPSFIYYRESYPGTSKILESQNLNFGRADWLLFNTFNDLELEVVNWMARQFPIKTIGPTIPSLCLDKRMKNDKDYGISFFEQDKIEACMKWLDLKATGSVVYVSFGSLARLDEEEMEAMAWGLLSSNSSFIWVVHASEQNKLPNNFISKIEEKGLVLNWCPQVEVLAHKSVGCFMTHCGWNSTLEALSLGVPMVVMPKWSDQTTNAKFIVDVLHAGIRVKTNEKGIVLKDEIAMSIKQILLEEKGTKLKNNVLRWKKLAKAAMDVGGSSDKNIDEFVSSLTST